MDTVLINLYLIMGQLEELMWLKRELLAVFLRTV